MGRRGRRRYPRQRPEHEHRVNERIRFPEIRVILANGQQAGIMTPDQGRALAKEHGLDLVEVAPDARPPVCKLMDYGKFRYDQSKRKASSQSAKTSLKTIRLRPKTDDHDLDTKRRRAEKFLRKGDTVRLEMRMRGRERAYPRRWIEVMSEFIDQFDEELEVVSRPHAEGRNISATLQPAGS